MEPSQFPALPASTAYTDKSERGKHSGEFLVQSSHFFHKITSYPLLFSLYGPGSTQTIDSFFPPTHDHDTAIHCVPNLWGPQPSIRRVFFCFGVLFHRCGFPRAVQFQDYVVGTATPRIPNPLLLVRTNTPCPRDQLGDSKTNICDRQLRRIVDRMGHGFHWVRGSHATCFPERRWPQQHGTTSCWTHDFLGMLGLIHHLFRRFLGDVME